MCFTVPISDMTDKLYTQKELVPLKTPITEFHEKLYIPYIQKLSFNLPHVHILGSHHCGKEQCDALKRRGNLHGFFFHSDYAERLLSSFYHQTQS